MPPPTLVKMGNPLVRMLLGSPLHGMLDHSFLVLHLTGRKTGRRYDIPVGFVDMEGRLTVVTLARWRVNLRGGADVEVTLRGCLRLMHALLEEDPASVAVSYQAMINRIGWEKASGSSAYRCPADERRRSWNSRTRPMSTAGRSSLSRRGEGLCPPHLTGLALRI